MRLEKGLDRLAVTSDETGLLGGIGRASLARAEAGTFQMMSDREEIRDFLLTRRARITPEQARPPAFGGKRRVPGLRREEVALLAGISAQYQGW